MISARFGAPIARPISWPFLSKTKVVGVERISSFRTKSKFASASISICLTSDKPEVISVNKVRVARHGVQKADENCTKVARELC